MEKFLKNKILISGIGKRNSFVRILNSLAKKFNIDIIGADCSNKPPARIEVNKFYKILPAYNKNFRKNLNSIIKKNKINACISLIDPEIPFLSDVEKLSQVRMFHPNNQISSLCEDKYKFYLSAKKAGISTIQTSIKPFKKYPFIVKDRFGSASSGFKIIFNKNFYDYNLVNNNYVFQPYCDGRHFCVDAYVSYYTGDLIDFCIKEVLNKKNGESFVFRSIISKKITSFVEEICCWLPFKGFINFDIYEDQGILKLMEINCRVGGNYIASHKFGCNLIDFFLSEVTNSSPTFKSYSNYKKNKYVFKFYEFSNIES